MPELGEVSIVLEERHEFDRTVEASVHVVRIQVPDDRVDSSRDPEQRIVAIAEAWVRDCVAERRLSP